MTYKRPPHVQDFCIHLWCIAPGTTHSTDVGSVVSVTSFLIWCLIVSICPRFDTASHFFRLSSMIDIIDQGVTSSPTKASDTIRFFTPQLNSKNIYFSLSSESSRDIYSRLSTRKNLCRWAWNMPHQKQRQVNVRRTMWSIYSTTHIWCKPLFHSPLVFYPSYTCWHQCRTISSAVRLEHSLFRFSPIIVVCINCVPSDLLKQYLPWRTLWS